MCTLCANAGQKCSYSSPASTAEGQVLQLNARVQWLSQYINDTSGIGDRGAGSGGGIETVETGSDLRSLLGTGRQGLEIPPSGNDDALADSSRDPYNSSSSSHHRHQGLDGGRSHAALSLDDTARRRFVDAYFRNVNRAYPFVDQAKILTDLNSPGQELAETHGARFTLLYLVMAIGCTTLERAGQVPLDTSRRFDVAYADIIQECLASEKVESIQILVLLALYSLFDPAGTSSYSIVGIAARQAILAGLCRRSTPSSTGSSTESNQLEGGEGDGSSGDNGELRHRLYWSIYVLDRMMAASHGLPAALTDDSADVPLPGLTISEFASPDRITYARNLQTSRHVIQLRQLEDRILRLVHLTRRADLVVSGTPSTSSLSPSPTSPQGQRATLAALRADIEDWYSSGCLLMSPVEPDNVPIHSSITWLSARYYHLLLLLYYPNGFNASAAAVSRSDLLQFARRQLQSTSVLFQQRQLPLNRVTLCRLFPVALVLMHDFAASRAGATTGGTTMGDGDGAGGALPEPYAACDEVSVVISILEAFPETWAIAHRAAQVVRQFSSLTSGTNGSGSGSVSYFVDHPTAYPLSNAKGSSTVAASGQQTVGEAAKGCIGGLTDLMRKALGKTSCFQYVEYRVEEKLSLNKGVANGALQGHTHGHHHGQESVPPATSVESGVASSRGGMMDMTQMGMDDDAVMDYGWGLDIDFL